MKTAILLAVLLINIHSLAQSNFSARTNMILNKLEKSDTQLTPELRNELSLYNENNREYVNVLIKVSDQFDESFLLNNGIIKRSRIANILSLSVPVERFHSLKDRKDIKYVSADSKIKPLLDNATSETNIKLVHDGFELPSGITGTGVIVGVIDFGFDYTHPMFFNNADSLRISRVWEQQEQRKNPPAGYNYGMELKTKEEILTKKRSSQADYESHGTHVAGIAAGSGYLTNGKYTGAAPGSEIVLVELGYSESFLIDAVSYIFDYAASVGKPAVINMSIGSQLGPHDGTSLIDQAFDELQGEGKILVGAAGNDGDNKIHVIKPSGKDSIRTVWQMFNSGTFHGFNTSEMNVWGPLDETFSVRFSVVDTLTRQMVSVSEEYSTDNEGYSEVLLKSGNDTLAVIDLSAEKKSGLNGKGSMFFTARVKNHLYLALTLLGKGEIHGWDLAERGFSDIGLPMLFNDGDCNYSMGEVGGTSKNIITVGAYTTKTSYVNLDGEEREIPFYAETGDLAGFSSRGPTTDGRTKPDITAPGNAVASSISSYDISFKEEIFSQYLVDKTSSGDKDWMYAVFQGTSMSSPVTAGTIALMLGADPTLSAAEIKNIFRSTGREDSFTGEISEWGSNTWGYGKIDALSSVKAALNPTDVEDDRGLVNDFILFNNYPNPFNPSTKISYNVPVDSKITLEVFDLLGRQVAVLVNDTKPAGKYDVTFDASQLSSGIYIYRLSTQNFLFSKKMILIK